MNPIIYVIIALVILIVIVLALRSKGKSADTTAPVAQPTPKPESVTQQPSVSVPQTPQPEPVTTATQPNYAATAQDYINQERYDDAINELQTGLNAQPNDDAMMLKLLTVYSLANNREEFDHVYGQIQTHGDMSTLQQARDLKTKFDAANPTAAAPVVEKPTSISNGGLDFDFDEPSDTVEELDFSSSDVSDAAPADDSFSLDDGLSLDDDLSFGNTDTITTETIDVESPAEESSDNDLSFADLESDLLDTKTPVVEEVIIEEATDTAATDDDLAFDFSDEFSETDEQNDAIVETTADITQTDITQTDSTEPTDDVFDLSFDDVETDLPEVTIEEVVVDTVPAADSDMLLEEEAVHVLNPTEDNVSFEENVLSFDDIDTVDGTADIENVADIENIETAALDVVDTAPTTDVELGWDEPLEEAVTDIQPTEDATAIIDSDINGDDTDALALNDTFAQLDALSVTDSGVLDSLDDADDSVDAALIEQIEETSPLADLEQTATTPEAPVATVDDSEFAETFDFVQGLDNAQITLDLAQQYLDLGEYDSAKRLVNEVLDGDSTDAQKSTANDILARMN